jgi:DNA-binding CsgD family transcriptional regulator/tetratricopeptide (TPR) repeat protein
VADLLCPIVVGRAHELEALRRALVEARDGRGSVALLVGEAGIGKSRLARELVADATAAGMVVLRGRAVPGGTNIAFRPLADALGPFVGDLTSAGPALEPWIPALSGVVPGLGRPPADGVETGRSEALVRALAALADGRGGMLVLEDLHWADPDTLALVEHLTDNLERAPVLCVVTVRSDEPSGGLDLARAVASRRSAPVFELDRLNDAQAAAMVHACTGGTGTVDVPRVIEAADGVPFLVEELLASPGMPQTFAETVHRRLEPLAATTRAVLASAATFGRHFDWHLLAAATALDGATVADALEQAVGAQLLAVEGDGFRFRHALTRDAVLDSVLPPRRPAIATAALAALDAAHPELRGQERELAAALAERAERPERAGALFHAIGADALGQGALATAIVALTRATQLLRPGDERTAAALALVDALAHAGRLEDALTATRALVSDVDGDAGVTVHLSVARAAMAVTRWELAATELEQARRLLDDDADAALLAQFAVREAELAMGTNDPTTAIAHAREALANAVPAGVPAVACEALLLLGRAARRRSTERAETSFTEAAAIAEAHDLPVWRMRSLHELGTIAMLERGDPQLLLEAREVAGQLGALATTAVLDLELCACFSISGDVDASIERGLAAAHRAAALGQHQAEAIAWVVLSTSYLERGERDEALGCAARARLIAPTDPTIQAFTILGIDGLRALLDEDRAAALAAFESGTTILHGVAAAPASFRGLWPLLLAADGDARLSSAIAEVDASGATVNRLNVGYLQLARAALVGPADPEAARALAAEGDANLAHGPFWQQLGRRLIAEAARDGGWADPSTWATPAATWWAASGEHAIAAACRRLASRAPTWALAELGVTRREAQVLALVHEGLANKEIAERLYLSPRTVEKHVESLLRKTAARSRTQLATLVQQTDIGST